MAVTISGSTPTFSAATGYAGGVVTSGTSVNSTSGTSINYTSIPSWVKRITVMYSGVSTSGSSNWQVQLGTSGGIVTSGYLGAYLYSNGAGGACGNPTTGFVQFHDTPTNVRHGIVTICLLDSSSNTWAGNGFTAQSDANYIFYTSYSIALSGALTQLRITTVNGTDTFTAGKINILYE